MAKDTAQSANEPINASEEAAVQFLHQVLSLIGKTNGERKQIHQFFRTNLNKLNDESLLEALSLTFEATLKRSNVADNQQYLAWLLVMFSVRISEFPLGNHALNLELGIAANKLASKLYTRDHFPNDWAGIQNNLGIAYSNRIHGDRSENLENSIHAYKHALKVRTENEFPQDWAMTQNNLGIAYSDRIRGDRAENLENAIHAYEQALKVCTQNDFSQTWAMIQNNLGEAYRQRIRGDHAENLENAIHAYKQVLKIYTQDDFPQPWAMTQNNLGNAYSSRIYGDSIENLENAIYAYEQVFKVYTQKEFPQSWALVQNNIGAAYRRRIRGNRAENLENAINAYQQALMVYTQHNFPIDWAATQNNLGIAYSDRIYGNRAENLENAIHACQQALKVYTQNNCPADWALTLNNLGTAYMRRIRGKRAENVEKAICTHENALTVYTKNLFPQDWAWTQGLLIAALLEKFQLNGQMDGLDAAISVLKSAQTVALPSTDSYIFVSYTLGIAFDYRYKLHQNPGDLRDAITAYKQAAENTLWDSRRAKYKEKAANSQYRLGVALTEAGQWYNGLAQLEASLDTYRQGTNRLARADALQQMARTHYLMSNFDKARLYFRDALRIYLAENNAKGEATCRFGLGRLLLRLNFVEDAIAELDRACTLFRELQDATRLPEVEQVYELARKVRERQPI